MRAPAETTSKAERHGIALLLVLLVAHVLVTFFVTDPGYLNVDECVYHMMVKSLATSGALDVWNGYAEFPSPELKWKILSVVDGGLVPQYPPVYGMVALPFYLPAGFRGLFYLNSLAFVVGVTITYRLALALFADRGLAVVSCLILVLTTFAWEYSQGPWPHALTMLAVVGAAYLSLLATRRRSGRQSLLFAFAAGLVLGVGTGFRLDVFFALPALLFGLLLAGGPVWARVVALLVGLVPGLGLLSITNLAKFGSLDPFSYGPSTVSRNLAPGTYLPVLAVGVAALALLWLWTGPGAQAWLSRNRWRAGLALGAVAAVSLTIPGVADTGVKWLNGLYQLVVDLRIRDLSIIEPAQSRSADGAVVYLNTLKKSLLQSMPYLAVLGLPLAAALKHHKDQAPLLFLFIVPAAFIAPYSYLAWHGGLAFNMRYFVPTLPFLAILTAYAWREIDSSADQTWRKRQPWGRIAVLVAFIAVYLPMQTNAPLQEFVILTVPLAIAAGLAALLVARALAGVRRRGALSGLAGVAVMGAFTWAALVAFTYDAQRDLRVRHQGYTVEQAISPFVAPDSVLVVFDHLQSVCGMIAKDRVRLPEANLDDFRDFRRLVDHYLAESRPVYLWAYRTAVLEHRDLLDGLRLRPRYESETGIFFEVARGTGPLVIEPGGA